MVKAEAVKVAVELQRDGHSGIGDPQPVSSPQSLRRPLTDSQVASLSAADR
jgi:hypothetical protein